MPRGSEMTNRLARLFIYGKAKRKKTWWAMNAAAAGYNVIVLNGDKGAGIIDQVDPTVRHRINIINCHDTMKVPIFGEFIGLVLKGYTIKWDDTADKRLLTGMKVDPTHAHFVLDASKLTSNDVLVLDSWTSFVASCNWKYYLEKGIDITAIDPGGDTRGGFGYQDRYLAWCLGVITSLPCHVIVVGHETVNELTEPTENTKTGQMERTPTGEVMTQPASSSRAQGLKIASRFDDVLYFHIKGNVHYIEARPAEDREGGSRHFFGEKRWEEWQFSTLAKLLGSKPVSDVPSEGCKYFEPGQSLDEPAPVQKMTASPQGNPVLASGSKPAGINIATKTKS